MCQQLIFTHFPSVGNLITIFVTIFITIFVTVFFYWIRPLNDEWEQAMQVQYKYDTEAAGTESHILFSPPVARIEQPRHKSTHD